MKILVISNLYPPLFVGGYELGCKNTVEELEKRGHELTILTSYWGLKRPVVEGNVHRLLNYDLSDYSESHKGSFDLSRLRFRFNQLKRAVYYRKNFKLTRQLIEAIKPDIVFIYNMGRVGATPVIAAQNQAVPTIFFISDYWLADLKKTLSLKPGLLKRKYNLFINGMEDFNQLDLKHLLIVSNTLKQKYIEMGFPEQYLKVILIGIPARFIIETNAILHISREDRLSDKLLFVGRLVPEKGPDIAIKAMNILVHEMGMKHISLDLIGGGPDLYVNSLKKMAIALKVEKHIYFLGKMERQQVFDLYGNYQILLFTSIWEEPFALIPIEAMAKGVSVIASDRGGSPEIISDGENGLIVPAEDPSSLAKAIKRLLEEENLAHNIRINALDTIREKYTVEHVVDLIMEYFEMILEGEGSIYAKKEC